MMGWNLGLLGLWHWQSDALTTRLDLILIRLDLIHTRLDLIHIRLDLIHQRNPYGSTTLETDLYSHFRQNCGFSSAESMKSKSLI